MDEMLPRSNRKRPFHEDFQDDDSNKTLKQKKVRFPKGKKVKPGEEAVVDRGRGEDGSSDSKDPRLAATERAKHRNQITADLFNEEINDISAAEITYEDNDNFVQDGVQIDPFNLDKEREEGYFDAAGNFVEYVNENDFKDPWLDSVEFDTKYAGKSLKIDEDEDKNNAHDLTSEEIGRMKRRIADLLEPGETVLQALRRLKGSSNKRKEKMSAETQLLFDQLTEDANKLLDHDVYHDKKEVFQREAEGYERLAIARGKGTSTSAGQEDSEYKGMDMYSDITGTGAASTVLSDINVGTSHTNVSTVGTPNNGADEYDMFADDDESASAKPPSDGSNLVSGSNSGEVGQTTSDGLNIVSQTETQQNDYVYDETSGYYYSSSSGYYYDPSTQLYCHATSGQWYSFNEETGTYEEIRGPASNAN